MTSGGKKVLLCGFITAAIVAWLAGELTANHFKTCEEAVSWLGDTTIVCEQNWNLGWLAGIAVFLVVKILSFQLSLVWSIAERLNPNDTDDDAVASPEVADSDASNP